MLFNPRMWGSFTRANFPGGHSEYEAWKKKWPSRKPMTPTAPDAIDPNAQFRKNPFPGMDDPNWSVSASFPAAQKGGGILDKFKDKKRWKHMVEALDKMKNAPIKPLAAGRNVGDSGIQYTPTDMGAYVGDPVARQTAMAKARMEEDLQRRKKLLGGGY